MKLPNSEQAIVDPRKLREYALSNSHPVGRFKAAFLATLGFTAENWSLLDVALRSFAGEGDVESSEATGYGQKHRIRSMLVGPNGRAAEVISVWIIVTNEVAPRFVTIVPAR